MSNVKFGRVDECVDVEGTAHQEDAKPVLPVIAFAVLSTHSGDVQEVDLFHQRESAERHCTRNGGVVVGLTDDAAATAALREQAQEIERLRQQLAEARRETLDARRIKVEKWQAKDDRIKALEQRLEVDSRTGYDGIACRDVTIRELERDLAAERERVEHRNRHIDELGTKAMQQAVEIHDLRERVQGLEKDAERYRTLKAHVKKEGRGYRMPEVGTDQIEIRPLNLRFYLDVQGLKYGTLDAALDAMKKEPK